MTAIDTKVVMKTDIKDYPLFARGKVRDIYDLGEKLLFVASDRISAFDVVLPNGIPGKGEVLTQMSLFWFDFLKPVIDNHLITADIDQYPKPLRKHREMLENRSMIVVKAKRIDAECIVRGYISGSMWKELKEARKLGSNTVHGFEFPPNLTESEKLPQPMFTPSSKNEKGHDENISFEELEKSVGKDTAAKCREKSLKIYQKAADYALTKGIIIADTKFEFGFHDSQMILIDEVLSPDSSRFWPADEYRVGQSQPSFDKQPIRDYLESLNWNKKPPAPELPDDVVRATSERYCHVKKLLTGK
jgi:phosphoribosylaminoimidazole-succinocarboxamide synthase